ncbi:hypothetical protein [Streptomyces smyrnaeus]
MNRYPQRRTSRPVRRQRYYRDRSRSARFFGRILDWFCDLV